MKNFIINKRKNYESSFEPLELFKMVKLEVENYSKSHIYVKENGEITSELKRYLYSVFNVTNEENLIEKTSGFELYIKSGYGKADINLEKKKVCIYYDTFEMFYDGKKEISKATNAVKKLYENKQPSTLHISKVLSKISEKSDELNFKKSEKNLIASSIPNILNSNGIKLKKDDVIDINKVEIMDIVELGRKIIKKDRTILKEFPSTEIGRENIWQQYFNKYGTYLLFGSIRLDPQKCLSKEFTKETNNKYPDILTCNRFGFLDVIELKRSDKYLFTFDNSHNKFVPTTYLSSALSQLNGYLQIIPYAYIPEDAQKQGLECASGMLIAGCKDYLYNNTQTVLVEWMKRYNKSEEEVYFECQKELRRLNYSYSHMQVVLYDELIDTLELFINKVSN